MSLNCLSKRERTKKTWEAPTCISMAWITTQVPLKEGRRVLKNHGAEATNSANERPGLRALVKSIHIGISWLIGCEMGIYIIYIYVYIFILSEIIIWIDAFFLQIGHVFCIGIPLRFTWGSLAASGSDFPRQLGSWGQSALFFWVTKRVPLCWKMVI